MPCTIWAVRRQITSDAKELELADSILLPGVGAFPDAADKLRGPGLDQVLIAREPEEAYSGHLPWNAAAAGAGRGSASL